MESTTELATSLRRTFEHQCANLYELLKFSMIALKDVGRASAPHWCSLDQECDMLVQVFFDVWHNTRATRYFALFSEPLMLKHNEICTVVRKWSAERTLAFSNGADEFTH